MAITIDGKQYDETKLDDKHKNAIVQVQAAQNKLKQLQSEFENVQVLIAHHSKYLTENLPAAALIEATAEAVEAEVVEKAE
jgi:hypothetical protein|tara:strand:+ start:207 stop:449 length:243 start_codon:yes stop_codon:yes gene_type:complete